MAEVEDVEIKIRVDVSPMLQALRQLQLAIDVAIKELKAINDNNNKPTNDT